MGKTIHRISQLLSELNLSARQFDISIGTANGYTLRMVKNNASVGSDVIERISMEYPQVNLVWLITGKGDMFIEQSPDNSKSMSDQEVETYISEQIALKLESKKQDLINDILKEIEKN